MNKKIISTLMALLMFALTPFSVLASEDAVAEDFFVDAVTDDVCVEEVVEEEAVFTAASEEAEVEGDGDVLPGQIGAGFFQDSYGGMTFTGDDGKTTLVTGGNEIVLTQRLVANYGFIDRNQPNIIYIVYMNGKVYWYCYKYQGTSGKMNRLGNTAINGYNVTNGVVTGFQTASGPLPLLTESQVKEILGVDSGKPDDSGSTKPDDSSSTKPDDSSSTKPDDSSSTKPDDSGSTKPDDSSSTKPDDSGSTKPDDSSSTKPDDSSSTNTKGGIKIISVTPAYGYVEVECLINGQKVIYRLNTGDYGEILQTGITSDGLAYILFKNGKLVLWHPSMLKDGQTTVECGELYVVAENVAGTGIDGGVIYFYDSTGARIVLPTLEQLKYFVVNRNVLMYDYIVDNSVTNSSGYKTWTLLARIDKKYHIVKNANSGIELKFDQVKHNRIVFNGKKYKAIKASWSAGGDLFIKRGKNKVYVIRVVKKSDGTYKNKRMRFARRAKDLHIDPATNLADYVVLRNGDKVDCVTGKKI